MKRFGQYTKGEINNKTRKSTINWINTKHNASKSLNNKREQDQSLSKISTLNSINFGYFKFAEPTLITQFLRLFLDNKSTNHDHKTTEKTLN